MTVEAPLLSETLYSLLERRAEESPQAGLVTFTDAKSHSRSQMLAGADRAADRLTELGVVIGDRVALMIDNRVEFLHLLFGCAKLGVIVIPINTALRGRSLTHILELTSPSAVAAERGYADQISAAISVAVPIIDVDDLNASQRTPRHSDRSGASSVRAEITGASPAAIMFTSGTTGPSKGVSWSHQMGLYDAYLSCQVMDYRKTDTLYTCLPLFHINALFTSLVGGLMAGANVIVSPRFSASNFWKDIARYEATVTSMLGSMATILWRQTPQAEERDNSLRTALVIPAPKGFYDGFEGRFGLHMTQVYGSTDMSIPLGIPFGERRPGTCGKALPGWECIVANDDDHPVPQGQTGELLVRPLRPFVGQLGYWQMPDVTLQAWRNLWFHTGDIFRVDEAGWFYYVGRNKDAIRKGGENVSAFEVELAILDFPRIEETAVFGVPSELDEEEVAAIVVPSDGVAIDLVELRHFLEECLPFFAVPRFVAVRSELPKTETQKVKKDVLRASQVTADMVDLGPTRAARQRSNG